MATNSSKNRTPDTPDVDVAPPSNLRTDNKPAEKKVDLAAALEAQQASKASAAAARPNLPPPPRRKAPTDPFIQRKPPKRK
jgi:senataxin